MKIKFLLLPHMKSVSRDQVRVVPPVGSEVMLEGAIWEVDKVIYDLDRFEIKVLLKGKKL